MKTGGTSLGAAAESEQRYKRLLNSTTDYIFTVTVENGQAVETSHGPGCLAVTGYTAEEYAADPNLWCRMVPEEDRAAVMECAAKALAGDAAPPLEHRIVHKSGETRWVKTTLLLHKDGQGRVLAYDGLISDMTGRKRAEESLARERNLLRTLIDALPDAIYVKDTESRFLMANLGVARLMGAECPESLMGKRDVDFYPTSLAARYYADERRVIESGQPLVNHEEPVIDSRGRPRWFLTTKIPFRDRAGVVTGLVGIGRDITEQRAAEAELRQAHAESTRNEEALRAALEDVRRSHQELKATQMQLIQTAKLESVGALAAGVAHEVKNPLQIILMGIDFLSRNLGEKENLAAVLSDMRDAIKRADNIVRGLLEFSAAYRPEVRDEDLNDIIESSLALVKFELAKAHIKVSKLLAPDLPRLKLDRTKIQQVFINVLMNAIHSMPEGGSLGIGTYLRHLTEIDHDIGDRNVGRLRIGDTVDFQVGEVAVVAEVEDTGTGIPEDKLANIFDPFFTTKPAGKGTGLGLTVVKKIIELHGGTIQIRNRPSGGVMVTIIFKTWRTP